MSALIFFLLAPLVSWFWRRELVNLVSDCIAEGIRKSWNEGKMGRKPGEDQ